MPMLFCCRLIRFHPLVPSAKPKEERLRERYWWTQQMKLKREKGCTGAKKKDSKKVWTSKKIYPFTD
jgi:hypothetical protein